MNGAMNGERKGRFDEKRNADRVWWALCAVCALLAVADLMVHRHGHFAFEEWPTFYAAVGFGAFYLIVLAGKQLRKILMRPEDYYEPEDEP